jgi:hypothetical protein
VYAAKVGQSPQILQVVDLPPKLGIGEGAVQLMKVQVAAGTWRNRCKQSLAEEMSRNRV